MKLKTSRLLNAILSCIAIFGSIASFAQKGPSPENVEASKAKQPEDALKEQAERDKLAKEQTAFFEEYTRPIVKETNRRRKAHRDAGGEGLQPPVTDPTGPFLGDEAFEKKVWAQLSADVVKAREKRNLVDSIRALRIRLREPESDGRILPQKREALTLEIAALEKALVPVEAAESRAAALVSVIAKLNDAKGMRLVVPIAFETDIWAEWHGDYGEGSFISRVLDTLRDLVQFGVITEKVPFSEGTSKEARAIPWRKWFEANKEKYGLIYRLPPVGAKPEEPPKPAPGAPESAPVIPAQSSIQPASPKPEPASIESPAPLETPRSWWPIIAVALLLAAALALFLRRRANRFRP